MSKFTIKVELQSLKIEVEGSREDVPRLAERVGDQVGQLIKPSLLLAAKGATVQEVGGSNGVEKVRKKKGGTGTPKTAAEDFNIVTDSTTHGSPAQEWTTAQKAIWFLYVVKTTNAAGNLTAYSIAKAFNKHFKSAGTVNAGNVSKGLEKERMGGKDATVGADTNDGAAKYFLTDKGVASAKQLIKVDSDGSE